jgi:hypothetical protein
MLSNPRVGNEGLGQYLPVIPGFNHGKRKSEVQAECSLREVPSIKTNWCETQVENPFGNATEQ